MLHSSSSSASNCSDLSMHHAANFSGLPTDPAEIPRSSFFHDNGGLLAVTNVAASAPPPYYIHRTTFSHFLPLHLQLPDPVTSNATLSCSSPSTCQLPLPHVPSSPSSSSGDYLEFSTGAMRRVFSTGDLQVMRRPQSEILDDQKLVSIISACVDTKQVMNVSPPPTVASETYSQESGGPFTQKVGRYSAEERKEKIDRYRIKRRQRNFQKKITVMIPTLHKLQCIPCSSQSMPCTASDVPHIWTSFSMSAGRPWQIADQGYRAALRGMLRWRQRRRLLQALSGRHPNTATTVTSPPTVATVMSACAEKVTRAQLGGGKRR
jgi:hypothetical protein